MNRVGKAVSSLVKGRFVVLYDGDEREGEADMILHASHITPRAIETLRKKAGGLICLAIDRNTARKLGLPFYTDILRKIKIPVAAMWCAKTAYGDQPAFSISINHKNVYTGISDNDRAKTIVAFEKIIRRKDAQEMFINNFYSPGHVFILIGRGLKNRRGHTELALALAERAGLSPAVVLCEMLGRGRSLTKKSAKRFAGQNGLVFIEGRELWKGKSKSEL